MKTIKLLIGQFAILLLFNKTIAQTPVLDIDAISSFQDTVSLVSSQSSFVEQTFVPTISGYINNMVIKFDGTTCNNTSGGNIIVYIQSGSSFVGLGTSVGFSVPAGTQNVYAYFQPNQIYCNAGTTYKFRINITAANCDAFVSYANNNIPGNLIYSGSAYQGLDVMFQTYMVSCPGIAWYIDSDGDGLGYAAGTPTYNCVQPAAGMVSNNYDCFDSDPNNSYMSPTFVCHVSNIGSTSADVDDGYYNVYGVFWTVRWTHAGISDSAVDVYLPYTINGLIPNTNYTIRLHASNNACNNSKVSTTLTTQPACPMPTNLAVTSTCPKKLSISWSGVTSDYQVSTRRTAPTTSGWSAHTIVGATSYEFTGTPGATYEVKVRAKCSSSSYSWYTNSTSYTLANPPATPANVAVTSVNCTGRKVIVSWTPVSGITGYKVTKTKVGGGTTTYTVVGQSMDQLEIGPLTNNSTFNFSVAAYLTCSGVTVASNYSTTPLTAMVACREENSFTSLENENSISVFPNPATDLVTFSYSLKSDVTNLEISIYNVMGQKIATVICEPKAEGNYTTTWPIETTLPSGIYFVKMNDGETLRIEKLIKQ